MTPDKPRRFPDLALLLLGAAVALVFFILQLRRADETTLWLDEIASLNDTLRGMTCRDMVVKGIQTEASSSPLYLILAKAHHEARFAVGYLGLTPAVYYRLLSNLITVLTGPLACLLAWKGLEDEPAADRAVRVSLSGCALFAFYFQRYVYHYAGEMRPYSLWNGCWLLALVVATLRPRARILLAVLLSLLALTAVASCFQILALTNDGGNLVLGPHGDGSCRDHRSYPLR